MQPDQEKVIFVATLEHWKTLSIPNKEKLAELADLQFPPRGRKSASALTVKERDETFLDMIKNQQPNHMGSTENSAHESLVILNVPISRWERLTIAEKVKFTGLAFPKRSQKFDRAARDKEFLEMMKDLLNSAETVQGHGNSTHVPDIPDIADIAVTAVPNEQESYERRLFLAEESFRTLKDLSRQRQEDIRNIQENIQTHRSLIVRLTESAQSEINSLDGQLTDSEARQDKIEDVLAQIWIKLSNATAE